MSGSYSNDKNNLIGSTLAASIYLPPNAPDLYNADGSLNWSENGGSFVNPLGFLLQKTSAITNNLVSFANLGYHVVPGLDLKLNLGYTNRQFNNTTLRPKASYDPTSTTNSSSSFAYLSSGGYNVEPRLEYLVKIGKGKLQSLAGATLQQDIAKGNTINASNFVSDALLASAQSAGTVTATTSYNQYRYQALYGRLNYNIADKYIVNLTGRRDGSSRFGPGKQFANFGAIGAAWIFSSENVVKEALPFLSYGKLRGSYGITGNDRIGNYQYLDSWSATGAYQGSGTLAPTRLYNEDYAWEVNKKLEGALDLGVLNDKVLFSMAYFRNKSGNQLINYNLPGQTGFTSVLKNFPAIVSNKGWEIEIDTKNITDKLFSWTSSFNVTMASNKLEKFDGLEQSSYATQYVVGEPLNIQKSFHALGVDPQTGLYQFNGIRDPQDRVVIQNLTPKFYGGLANNFLYHGFSLDVFFQFARQKGLNTQFIYSAPGTLLNQPAFVLDRWQNPGDQTYVQRFSTGSGTANTAYNNFYYYSDARVVDASYIRLKNVSFSYSLPANWISKIRLSTVRLYFQAQNLFTITGYKGMDPETQLAENLPPLKVFTGGVQIGF